MTTLNPLILRRVVENLPRFQYRFSNEVGLHEGIDYVLRQSMVEFEREVVATAQDRFDFLVDDSIVIEAKVKGSLSPALRQCARYAALPQVQAVVLVATRFWAGTPAQYVACGKPIHIVRLQGKAF